ncbi:MAG: flagellar biosynthesis anti-sigma factor FlgM [Polyangia bacterium]
MTRTSGRLSRTGSAKEFARAVGARGADVCREARLEELRQMVASGRYRIQPEKLALKILVRALMRI